MATITGASRNDIGAAHMTTTIDAQAGGTGRPNGPPSPDHLDLLEAESTSALGPNEIGVVRLAVGTPLAVDPYRANRVTGSFVMIDEQTHATVAAGMVGVPEFAAVPQR